MHGVAGEEDAVGATEGGTDSLADSVGGPPVAVVVPSSIVSLESPCVGRSKMYTLTCRGSLSFVPP